MGTLHDAFRGTPGPDLSAPRDAYGRRMPTQRSKTGPHQKTGMTALCDRKPVGFYTVEVGPDEVECLEEEFGAMPPFAVIARYNDGESVLCAVDADGEVHIWVDES